MNSILRKLVQEHSHFSLPLPLYFQQDIWQTDQLSEILQLPKPVVYNKSLHFDYIENPYLREEIKRYFYIHFISGRLSLRSALGVPYTAILLFAHFFSTAYPHAKSLLDYSLPVIQYRYGRFLKKERSKPQRLDRITPKYKAGHYDYYTKIAEKLYVFLQGYYDDRPEHEKDMWQLDKLGLPYNMSRRETRINFTSILPPYRDLVKKYFYHVLLLQRQITVATALNILKKVYLFFNFIYDRHPDWTDLKHLQRSDIEAFLAYVWTVDMGGSSHCKNRTPSNRHVSECLANSRRILEYAQLYNWPEAPKQPIHLLLVWEDLPKRERKNYYDHIKHIPDPIWEQVQHHLHLLPPVLARLILVMEASGFRVSDVCQLNQDCLVYKSNGWWLKGDQRKVNHVDHLVPISEEIVTIVRIQQEYLQENLFYNPHHFLFPQSIGRQSEKAMSQRLVTTALARLAEQLDLRDATGNIYNFKNHAFRHRYGVNLINNGMQILHVQKLMAHTSSEMTLTYARILDSTLRKEWEKAQASIRLSDTGIPVRTDLSIQAEENGVELDWIRHHLDAIRMDHGFCIKSPKLHCDFLEQTLEPPCIKNNCRSFHVDQTFLDYYQEQIEQLLNDVKVYETQGRLRSIELVQLKIKRFTDIRDSLLSAGLIMGIEKAKREYVGEERNNECSS
ncbi:tyrosine-type recombinase/integrase [Paenibacillus shenyangensis]|uniref:tyrosine-type recombinase/integrase n=1 Tax=Paenibacillus sp. A9 TaxID=1284352 RepID=UPI000360A1E9|nr:site-specific integrase [Paenibacillus sp. A9]